MNKILVSGLINIETTVKISEFPIEYYPVTYPFFGVRSTVSGVGVNVSKALTVLGNEVSLVSMIGKDLHGPTVLEAVRSFGVDDRYILQELDETPQSVILYEESGRRQIHVDLKNLQDTKYPEELFEQALCHCSIAVLCNINYSRPFLQMARQKNKIVATDVHVLKDIYDPYNVDFMRYANILFMSNEGIQEPVEDFAWRVIREYDNDILVIGLGAEGALLYVKKDQYMERMPAVFTRNIINTIGAGDALFSAFIHFYAKAQDPYSALQKAIVFASYKIGEKGAAEGFLQENALQELYQKVASTKIV